MADGSEILTKGDIVLYASLVVPGFISMTVYSRLQPLDNVKLKEQLLEAIVFGLLNIVLVWPLVEFLNLWIRDPNTSRWLLWLLGILLFILLPAGWAFLLNWLMASVEKKGWLGLLKRAPTAWDEFFQRRESAFVVVRLKSGKFMGGQFGSKSFAALSPNSGHIYIEKLWAVTDTGVLMDPIPDSKGALLRPSDYDYLELSEVPHEPAPLEPIGGNQKGGPNV